MKEFRCLSLGCKKTVFRDGFNFDTGFCEPCQKELDKSIATHVLGLE